MSKLFASIDERRDSLEIDHDTNSGKLEGEKNEVRRDWVQLRD